MQALGVPYRHGALNHHRHLRIHAQHHLHNILHVRCVKEILDRVVVGGSRYDYKIGTGICGLTIQRCRQTQVLAGKVLLNLGIGNGAAPAIDHVHLVGKHVHHRHLMALSQKGGQ